VTKKPPVPSALRLAFVTLILAAVALLVGVYVFLPSLLERSAARGIQEGLGLESAPEVELDRGSPAEMVVGRFSGGRISLGVADLGGVRAERVTVDLDPFDLDVLGSMMGVALRSEMPLSGTLRAEVPEGEVSRLAEAGADVPVRGVDLREGEVVVGSEVPVLGVEVPVSVGGDLALRDQKLVFTPRRVLALGTRVPEQLAEHLLAGADFSYPLGGLPYGAEVTGVEVREGRLVVSGALERVPIEH
jgi:hypothetical protein